MKIRLSNFITPIVTVFAVNLLLPVENLYAGGSNVPNYSVSFDSANTDEELTTVVQDDMIFVIKRSPTISEQDNHKASPSDDALTDPTQRHPGVNSCSDPSQSVVTSLEQPLDQPLGVQISQIPYRKICNGAAASLSAAVVTYGLDKKKLYQQAGKPLRGPRFKGFGAYSVAMCSGMSVTLPLYYSLVENDYKIAGGDELTKIDPFWAGMISGGAGTILSTPAYVFRVQKTLVPDNSSKTEQYTFKSFARQVAHQPSFALRGMAMNGTHTVAHGINFSVYEILKRYGKVLYKPEDKVADTANNFICGATARIIASGFTYPAVTVQVMRQSTGKSYPEIFRDLNSRGIGRYFEGLTTGVKKNSLSAGIYMAVYSLL